MGIRKEKGRERKRAGTYFVERTVLINFTKLMFVLFDESGGVICVKTYLPRYIKGMGNILLGSFVEMRGGEMK